MREGSLLVLEVVERDEDHPSRMRAWVRIGGHLVDVVFDFLVGGMRFIGYHDIPWVMRVHEPSLKAVGRVVERIERGELVELPLDLSEEVRDSDPPNPWVPSDPGSRQRSDTEAERIDLELRHLETGGDDGRGFVARFDLNGELQVVEGECYVGEGAVPMVRWLSKEVIRSLSNIEQYAIWRLIVQEIEHRQREG